MLLILRILVQMVGAPPTYWQAFKRQDPAFLQNIVQAAGNTPESALIAL